MNWVNSSLQLAGNLLESVDQQAALTLSAEDNEGLLSSIKKGINKAAESIKEGRNEEFNAAVEEIDYAQNYVVEHEVESQSCSSNAQTPRDSLQKELHNKTADNQSINPIRLKATPPNSTSGKNTSSTIAIEEEYNRLRKETNKLKSDLRAKELQLVNAQKNQKVCEEEMEALEIECKNKVETLEREITRLQQEKISDEQNFVQALELKDTQVQNIQQELQKLHTVKKLHEEEINSLKKEVQHALESKDKLWSNAASASNESEQLIFALRNELQETLSSMSNLKKEYAESKANMYIRQEQLEKSNAELGKNVVDLEKELLDLVAKTKMIDSLNALPASSINNNDNSSNSSNSNHLSSNLLSNSSVGSEEYRVLQQNLIAMKKSFHEESRRNEVYKQEILGLTQELKKVKNTFEKAEESFAKDSLILRKENENLKEKLQEHLSKENNDTTSINMEARIQILTNRLIEKQESIDAYRSKMTTLEIRLSDAQNRNRIVEEKLQHFQRNGGIIDDVEMASETPHQNRGGLRARTNRLSHAISQVAPVLDRSTRVVTALDVVDKWLLFLGRFFLNYPFARLAMLAYLGLIHFWVFVVLSFHTSHLQEEIRQTAPPRGGVID